MWKLVLHAAALMASAPSVAQSVHFECSMSNGPSKSQQREVTFDEQTGSLSWDSVDGGNQQMNAVVNGDTIIATDDMGADVKDIFTINRATGTASSVLHVNNQPSSSNSGTCKEVAELPKFAHDQFTAAEYEFAAHFIALIQSRRLDAAKRMIAPGAEISTWTDAEGVRRTLEEFASYISRCPVRQFEGVNTRAAHNLNVDLDCPGNGGASIEFDGGRISSIKFGGPPPVISVATSPHQ